MPRPFELFSGYDFFSVLLPGLAAATLAFLFLPAPVASQIGPLTALIPVLVLSFSLGQGLHAIAHWLEKQAGRTCFVTPHREIFSEQIQNPDWISVHIVDSFTLKVAELLLEPTNQSSINIEGKADQEADWSEIYTFVQSYIYTHEIGRSRKFQSIYSFCRSLMVLSFVFPIVTYFHNQMQEAEFVFDRTPQYTTYFQGYPDFMEVSLFLGFIGTLVFWYGAYSYKRNFVRYLISDFVAYSESENSK